MIRIFDFVTLVAATWYLSFVLAKMSGPFHLFFHLREWRNGYWHGRSKFPTAINADGQMEVTPVTDGLFDCIICLAPWVAGVLYLVQNFLPALDFIVVIFAVAGVALWIHGFTGWRHNTN